MLGISLWELVIVGTACMGVPLVGAGIVVAIAMPLRKAGLTDGPPSARLSELGTNGARIAPATVEFFT